MPLSSQVGEGASDGEIMLLTRRFLPYFVTQCLGALNDNIYKNVLLLLVTFSQVELPISVDVFVNLAAGLFILPFLLFSAHAGRIADNMDKAKLIRRLKLLEVIIMFSAAIAIVTQSYMMMLLMLFLTGSQSAYFGPVKYSLLPQALKEDELVTGNAWVELGTFIAILTGTLGAGLLMSAPHGSLWAAVTVASLALVSYLSSCVIPALPAPGPVQIIPFRPLSGTWASLNQARQTPSIWMAIVAISWFWFLGATYLTQLPNFAKLHLHSDATVVSLLLALFSIGIAAGSFLCERCSFGHVELGLVPFGVLGLTLFGMDLYWATPPAASVSAVYGLASFIAQAQHYRVMLDFFMVGVSGGLFIVPLYAFIQSRSRQGECAQAIAANNIMNALFMVTAALLSILLLSLAQWSIPQLFLLLAGMNVLVAWYIYARVPEFTQRLISYLVSHLWYRVRVVGRDNLPREGAALLVCQYVSPACCDSSSYFSDSSSYPSDNLSLPSHLGHPSHLRQLDPIAALIIMGIAARPIRVVQANMSGETPQLNAELGQRGRLLLGLGTQDEEVCAADSGADSSCTEAEVIRQALVNGELVCLFINGHTAPEAALSRVSPDIASLLTKESVPLLAMTLDGMGDLPSVYQVLRRRVPRVTVTLNAPATVNSAVALTAPQASLSAPR